MNFDWKWKTAFIVFMIYVTIAKYCAFKLAVGLTTTCGGGCG